MFTDSRTEGLVLVALGRAYAAQGRYDPALNAFRDGVEIVGQHGTGLRLDALLPFFRLGLAEAERNPGRRGTIDAEMFEASQLVRSTVVAQSMAMMSARLAESGQGVGVLIRDLQDARRRRDQIREQLTLVQSDPGVLDAQPGALMSALDLPSSCRGQADAVAHAPRLPETARELQSVAGALGGANVVLGSRFSEATLRQTPLSNYRIVSFATHGLLPSKLQCLPEPALLVSKSPGGGRSGDGLLTSSEVLDLKMDADLVVLSACDTGGSGGAAGGEALTGLARAFFYAGTRTMMVTHWEIPSTFSAELVSDTFRRGAKGSLTIAEALRDAQKAMIAQPLSHPKAWAAFTVVGDGGQRLR